MRRPLVVVEGRGSVGTGSVLVYVALIMPPACGIRVIAISPTRRKIPCYQVTFSTQINLLLMVEVDARWWLNRSAAV